MKRYSLTIAALLVLIGAGIYAQVQQSGGAGSTVTANQGGAPWSENQTQIAGTAVDVNSGVKSAGTQRIVIATDQPALTNALKVDGSGVTQPVSGTVSVNALPTGSNVIGTVSTIPKTACGTTVASQALAAVPTSSTAVFSSTTCLQVIVVNNTNGSAATVTITDNQGTPINDILTFSIPANSQIIQPLWGVAFTSGVKWSASGTGLTGALLGYQ